MPRWTIHITRDYDGFHVYRFIFSHLYVELSKLKIRSSTLTAVHRSSYQTLHSTLPLIRSLCFGSTMRTDHCAPWRLNSLVQIYKCQVNLSGYRSNNYELEIRVKRPVHDRREILYAIERRVRFFETKSLAYYFSVAQARACALPQCCVDCSTTILYFMRSSEYIPMLWLCKGVLYFTYHFCLFTNIFLSFHFSIRTRLNVVRIILSHDRNTNE